MMSKGWGGEREKGGIFKEKTQRAFKNYLGKFLKDIYFITYCQWTGANYLMIGGTRCGKNTVLEEKTASLGKEGKIVNTPSMNKFFCYEI